MNDHLIGTQISKFRKAAGPTQEELGEAVGISGQAVSRWECGGALDRENADRIEQNLLSRPELTLILVSHHLSQEQKKRFTQVFALLGVS